MDICCADKLYPDRALGASRLTAIALAHALSLFAAVASSLNVSGGHINPAVTFGSLVGGRISVVRAIYYWIAQLLGSVIASLLLRLATDGFVITKTILFLFFPMGLVLYHLYILKLKGDCCCFWWCSGHGDSRLQLELAT